MYTARKINRSRAICLVSCLILLLWLNASGQVTRISNVATGSTASTFSRTMSKGLEIKVLKSDQIDFIYAELVIFYHDKDINPAIPWLTLLNMFNTQVDRGGSNLLQNLKKLGNDFEIVNRPDYLLIKINLLRDRFHQFAQFLRGLYSYKSFTLKKFNYSIENYWRIFLGNQDWKKQAAFQVAYQKLFPGHLLGNALVLPGALKKINLAQVRSFYQSTYTLSNSVLFIKGNIEPGLAVGSINQAFKTFKKQAGRQGKTIPTPPSVVNDRREIIVFNTNDYAQPELFWFETIPPLTDSRHLPLRVLNDMIFAHFVGKLSHSSLGIILSNCKHETGIRNHHGVSLLYNNVRLNFRDIEKFILAADAEKKKLRHITRKDYLDAKNHFCGQLKIETRRYATELRFERDFSLFTPIKKNHFANGNSQNNTKYTPQGAGHYYISFEKSARELTLEKLNNTTPGTANSTIVIVGNAAQIIKYFTVLKPQVIRVIQ